MIKKLISSILWFITVPLCIYTLFVYLLSYSLLSEYWVSSFMMMSLQVAILGCFIVMLTYLFIRPSRSILPFMVLLLGFPFVIRTIHFGSVGRTKQPLSVLSYNVAGFYGDDYDKKKDTIQHLIGWVDNFDADIKCLQEFYNWDETKAFQTIKTFKKNYPHTAFTQPEGIKNNEGELGLAVFSKYPIIYQDERLFSAANNGYLICDIVRDKDTIRIINVHLWSMGIRVGRVAKELKQEDYDDAKKESKSILNLLKIGFKERLKEIKVIRKLVDKSPYPIILCGDFNETPYGHAYGSIRDRLNNAFEEGGNGFGFTLNRSPKYIRIDNQFFSDPIQLVKFITHKEVQYSDHFPISAVYCLEK